MNWTGNFSNLPEKFAELPNERHSPVNYRDSISRNLYLTGFW